MTVARSPSGPLIPFPSGGRQRLRPLVLLLLVDLLVLGTFLTAVTDPDAPRGARVEPVLGATSPPTPQVPAGRSTCRQARVEVSMTNR